LNQWIDIHSHILPAVDDGSVSMMQTKNMLQIAYDEGITFIIATPHYGVGCLNVGKEVLQKKLDMVRQIAEEIDENFRIELGNELFFSDDIIEHLRKQKALTLAGTRYVLVEFAKDVEYMYMRTGLHRLLIHGYYPVLAHVERYECLYQKYEDIYDLIRLGVYMQMNISSILGNITDRRAVFCKKLIDYELVHLISTDSHSDHRRAPRMREGLKHIQKKFGDDIVKRLLIENTTKLLNNQHI
jgi:protein-tyrosine phosphatase